VWLAFNLVFFAAATAATAATATAATAAHIAIAVFYVSNDFTGER
jgi:hypothetical protein